MTDIERLRHSAAHVLATASLRIWPDAQFAAGPPVENGFYYDVELGHRISPEDFGRIEEEMKKEIKANHVFERVEISREEALAMAERGALAALEARGVPSKFKLDIIQGIPEGEPISIYRNGAFTDLCAGPHVMRTGNVGAFRLTHVASAYYKGDERNPQLQRIYGTAFKNKTELEAYFTMLEEAKKRDHRKLGKELELFCFDDDVGPGLPLWLPRGTVLIEELEKLAKETEFAALLIPVARAVFGQTQRQVPVTARYGAEKLVVMRAVHRLEIVLLRGFAAFLATQHHRREHGVLVVGQMPAGEIHVGPGQVRRADPVIPGGELGFFGEFFELLDEHGAAGQPKR